MLQKLPYNQSSPVFERFDLSDEYAEAVKTSGLDIGTLAPKEALSALIRAELYLDALNFLSHGLPVRESIWWAAVCQRQSAITWSASETTLIQLSQSWVKNPEESLRRDIDKRAEGLGFERPASWLGKAVFYSGAGSIGEEGGPMVAPQPFLHAKMIFGAVALIPVIEASEDDELEGNLYATIFDAAHAVASGEWP